MRLFRKKVDRALAVQTPPPVQTFSSSDTISRRALPSKSQSSDSIFQEENASVPKRPQSLSLCKNKGLSTCKKKLGKSWSYLKQAGELDSPVRSLSISREYLDETPSTPGEGTTPKKKKEAKYCSYGSLQRQWRLVLRNPKMNPDVAISQSSSSVENLGSIVTPEGVSSLGHRRSRKKERQNLEEWPTRLPKSESSGKVNRVPSLKGMLMGGRNLGKEPLTPTKHDLLAMGMGSLKKQLKLKGSSKQNAVVANGSPLFRSCSTSRLPSYVAGEDPAIDLDLTSLTRSPVAPKEAKCQSVDNIHASSHQNASRKASFPRAFVRSKLSVLPEEHHTKLVSSVSSDSVHLVMEKGGKVDRPTSLTFTLSKFVRSGEVWIDGQSKSEASTPTTTGYDDQGASWHFQKLSLVNNNNWSKRSRSNSPGGGGCCEKTNTGFWRKPPPSRSQSVDEAEKKVRRKIREDWEEWGREVDSSVEDLLGNDEVGELVSTPAVQTNYNVSSNESGYDSDSLRNGAGAMVEMEKPTPPLLRERSVADAVGSCWDGEDDDEDRTPTHTLTRDKTPTKTTAKICSLPRKSDGQFQIHTTTFHKGSGRKPLGFSIVGGRDTPLGSKGIFIKSVFPNGQAANALMEGDELVQVNKTLMKDLSHEQAIAVFRKIRAGEVVVSVKRKVGSGKRDSSSSKETTRKANTRKLVQTVKSKSFDELDMNTIYI